MQNLGSIQDLSEIECVLKKVHSIAVVGLSPKENRPSNMVARYLMDKGYAIYPVNPGQTEILGRKCYPDLEAIPDHIDLVDIFRRSEDIPPVVDQAIKIGAEVVWMQQGIVNEQAAELARKKGLFVVMDRCIKVDHTSLDI
ncbi:CoA-binding protein [Desulfomarina sp.]